MKKALLFLTAPVRWLLAWVVALVILFEEWGWEPLQRLLRRIVLLLRLQRLEVWLQTLPPYAAFVALAVPSLMLLPAKLAAFALISKGHVIWGGLVFIAAKLIGTAVIARVFSIVQPSLMQLAWFARGYSAWKRWKDALLAHVRSTRAWQQGKAFKASIANQLRKWLRP
ncbi:MAG: hypothetical protein EAZ37_02840 [Burkholderiales bacterium]|nr:MAG: hypothetical protein EAZ37_02840 [Burkholderiales bacterium]